MSNKYYAMLDTVNLNFTGAGAAAGTLSSNAHGLYLSVDAAADVNVWLYFRGDADATLVSSVGTTGQGILIPFETASNYMNHLLPLSGQKYVYAYASAACDVYITQLL